MFARPDCKLCKGEGLIQVDDLNTRLCMCAYAQAMRTHLGPEIASASNLKESPLYVRSAKDGELPTFDRTSENVFIRCMWAELLPHFKFTLVMKGIGFRHRTTTDAHLKDIWLGYESYRERAKSKRDDLETYNTLSDFVVDPHLLIIRLGYLGHKNIAMPGIVKETLMLREAVAKPTWLIEDPERLFGPGNHSYSDELQSYIVGHFKVNLDLTPEVKAETPIIQWTVPTVGSSKPEMGGSGFSVEEDDPTSLDDLMGTPKSNYGAKPKFGSKKPSGGKWRPAKPKMGDDFEQ